jgi:histidine kinase
VLRSLGGRLFVSYAVVIVICLAVIAGAASVVGPRQFARGLGGGPRFGQGTGGGPSATGVERLFRSGLASALVYGSLAALLAAGIASVLLTRRIVRPVHRLAEASRRIAEGRYEERVPVPATIEIAALAASFNTMAEALEQTEARRRALLADVAHELRTPLATLGGYLEGLTDQTLAAEPEIMDRMSGDVRRLQRLVSDMEELSRLEASTFELRLSDSPPGPLLGATLDRLRPQAEAKGVALHLRVEPHLPAVRIDADRIQQVLLNLIGNAIQYTPGGGSVTVSARREDGWMRVEVADTGIGIAPEHLPHLFERFYRIDRSRARAGGGSGLGLTIARRLVDAHGGRIWAESPGPGRGSAFSFTLPLAR